MAGLTVHPWMGFGAGLIVGCWVGVAMGLGVAVLLVSGRIHEMVETNALLRRKLEERERPLWTGTTGGGPTLVGKPTSPRPMKAPLRAAAGR
jgi:hypothetical protein